MSKILAVFGATGNQGGSVVTHVLSDPQLSKEYSIRAITRDASSAKAQALKACGVAEVVAADLTDASTLPAALAGAHTVFLLAATPGFGGDIRSVQRDSVITGADACVAAGVQRIVYSTLPFASKISGGKYTGVAPFDGQAEGEEYIRGLSDKGVVRSSFVSASAFMQNYRGPLKPRPSPAGDGTYVFTTHVGAESKLPLIDITELGKWVAAILADFDKLEGKTLCAGSRQYTMLEIVEHLSASTGKKVVYKQVSSEDALQLFGGDRNPAAGVLVEMQLYEEEFGYFGPDTDKLVRWSVENAKGHISTFEEYLQREPIQLD
ncbi:uncharacterized protein B0I36DRAFT_251543 [Microdochium trichocladiopsis]|uniref:NmrA-like domain-containing protein n=1 Tax=Microdochium trichocladiopsis TaxID=1682393 RepID=A0A9P8XWE8_9PEZI|nr:uncharacterized protein B0I36DRAFT_251543 [Microdochium trichocladiopsis]KAH7021394.1 hypothetical protein B0I36DRAFT_251543 [Microdochium trichocladiopsis]